MVISVLILNFVSNNRKLLLQASSRGQQVQPASSVPHYCSGTELAGLKVIICGAFLKSRKKESGRREVSRPLPRGGIRIIIICGSFSNVKIVIRKKDNVPSIS